MKKENALALIFALYLTPIFLLAAINVLFSISGLTFLSLGLISAVLGSILLTYVLPKESSPQEENTYTENPEEHTEDFQQQIDLLKTALEEERSEFSELLEDKDNKICTIQDTLKEAQDSLAYKQQCIGELEAKIADLSYEIKTLLNLEEPSNMGFCPRYDESQDVLDEISDAQVKTDDQALLLLKRCLDIAHKITSANHFSQTSPRFRDFPLQSSTLDLRRLIDALKSESGAGVFLYSQKDTKALFANSYVKILLGWSPDQFIHNFQGIIDTCEGTWGESMQQLNLSKELCIDLELKSKTGHPTSVRCALGKIFTGVFRNHIIGIFYLQHASSKTLNISL